mgnify:CR=1 FL=1
MRKRIKSREVEASSKDYVNPRAKRSKWVRTHQGAFPRIKAIFCYNDRGVNFAKI